MGVILHPHLYVTLLFFSFANFIFAIFLYKMLKKKTFELCLQSIKNAQEIFKQNQEMQTIVDASPLLIIYKDTENRILRANRTFSQIFRKDKSSIEGKSCFDIFPQYAQKWWEEDLEVITTGKPKRNIIEKITVSSRDYWLQTDKYPVKDNSGKVIGIFSFSSDITEKRKISEKMRKDRAKLRIFFDSISEAIFIETLEGDIIDCNLAAEKLLGYTRDELLRLKVRDLVSEEVSKQIPEIINVLRSGKEFHGEAINVRKDGQKIPVEVSAKLIDIEGEKFVFTVVSDISEKKEYEKALLESEKKYRQLAENSHDLIFTFDLDGKILYLNEFAARHFGKSQDEIIGKNISEVFWHDTTQLLIRIIQKVHETRESIYIKELMKFPFKEVWMGTWFIPLKDDSGKEVLNILCIARDITDIKIAEEALKESEERYRIVITNLPDAVVIYRKGIILYVNDVFYEKYGYTEEEVIGKNVMDFVDEKYKKMVFQNIQKREAGEFVPEYEIEIFSKIHGYVPVLIKGSLINYDGQPAALIILIDITEKKLAEVQIKQLNEILREEKERAEKASMAKSNFIANMSHSLRTPITSIIAANEILLDSKLDDKQLKCVKSISYAAENLLSIINSILDLSKIESGKLDLSIKQFSIRELAKSTLTMLEYYAAEKNNELKLNVDEKVNDIVYTDPLRLQEILVNLLGNAIKFTDNGMVELSINYYKDNPKVLLFSIRDTGIGIPEEQIDKIFEKFIVIDDDITHRFSGTGLGLAIAKQLVELMGGSIWVESKSGQGSTFYFTIKQTEKEVFDERCRNIISKNEVNLENIRQARILFVEDSEPLRFLFKEYFTCYPHIQIDVAEDGEKAIELYNKNKYDIIFMDLRIPKIDGFEATKLIRQIEANNKLPRVPIIALSAFGMNEEVTKSLESGCDEHITKPVKKNQIYRVIENYLKVNK